MGVSISEAVHLHSMDGWALSGADVQAPWHGVLETVWLHCDEAQQRGACEDWKIIRWCRAQASSHNSQGVVDGRVNEASMSTAASDRSTVLCCWMDQGKGGCSSPTATNKTIYLSQPHAYAEASKLTAQITSVHALFMLRPYQLVHVQSSSCCSVKLVP